MAKQDCERRHNRKLLMTRLHPDDLQAFKALAQRESVSVYQLAARVLTEWIQQQERGY